MKIGKLASCILTATLVVTSINCDIINAKDNYIYIITNVDQLMAFLQGTTEEREGVIANDIVFSTPYETDGQIVCEEFNLHGNGHRLINPVYTYTQDSKSYTHYGISYSMTNSIISDLTLQFDNVEADGDENNIYFNGVAYNATDIDFSNVTVEGNVSVNMEDGWCGSVVGQGSGRLYECTNNADLSVAGANATGGIAGDFQGEVISCVNQGKITSTGNVAGIVGSNNGNITINKCVNKGTITGIHNISGIATGDSNFTIYGCNNYGDIQYDETNAGEDAEEVYAAGVFTSSNVNTHTINIDLCNNFGRIITGEKTICKGAIAAVKNGCGVTASNCSSYMSGDDLYDMVGYEIQDETPIIKNCYVYRDGALETILGGETESETTGEGTVTQPEPTSQEMTTEPDTTVQEGTTQPETTTEALTTTKVPTTTKSPLVAPKITNVTAKKKAIKITWTKKSVVSGYQIMYSEKSNFKKFKIKNVSGYKNVSATISKLKSKVKYYVKVRTYITTKKGKNYSKWSPIKNKKTK